MRFAHDPGGIFLLRGPGWILGGFGETFLTWTFAPDDFQGTGVRENKVLHGFFSGQAGFRPCRHGREFRPEKTGGARLRHRSCGLVRAPRSGPAGLPDALTFPQTVTFL